MSELPSANKTGVKIDRASIDERFARIDISSGLSRGLVLVAESFIGETGLSLKEVIHCMRPYLSVSEWKLLSSKEAEITLERRSVQ